MAAKEFKPIGIKSIKQRMLFRRESKLQKKKKKKKCKATFEF